MNLTRMNIRNISGLSTKELREEIAKGGKIIRYDYTVSLLVLTLQRKSGGQLVRPGENARKKGIPYSILSALFGWWGIPDGPRQTLKTIRTNMRGGRDVTEDVKSILEGSALFKELKMDSNPSSASSI